MYGTIGACDCIDGVSSDFEFLLHTEIQYCIWQSLNVSVVRDDIVKIDRPNLSNKKIGMSKAFGYESDDRMHERKIASLDLFLTRDWIPCREIRFLSTTSLQIVPYIVLSVGNFFYLLHVQSQYLISRTSKKSFSEIIFINISGNFNVFAHFYVKKLH